MDYAGFDQLGLCGRSPIMRKIMRAHNRIIQRSLVARVTAGCRKVTAACRIRIFWAIHSPKSPQICSSACRCPDFHCNGKISINFFGLELGGPTLVGPWTLPTLSMHPIVTPLLSICGLRVLVRTSPQSTPRRKSARYRQWLRPSVCPSVTLAAVCISYLDRL